MKLKILEEAKNENKELKNKINSINKEMNDYIKNNEDIKNKYYNIVETNKTLVGNINELNEEMNSYKEKYESLFKIQEDQKKEQSLLDSKYNINKYNDLFESYSKMKSTYDKLNKSNNELKTKYTDLQNE